MTTTFVLHPVHVQLYESPDLAIACLSAAHTVIQLVVGLSSGPEVVGKLVSCCGCMHASHSNMEVYSHAGLLPYSS